MISQQIIITMKVKNDKLITATFVILCLGFLAAVAALVLRIIKGTTGLGLSYFDPGCTNAYNTAKYKYAYLSIKAQFIGNIVAVATSLVVILVLIPPLLGVCKGKGENNDKNAKEGEQQVKLEVIYVMTCICVLGCILAAGGTLNIWIQANTCSFQVYYNSIITTVLSAATAALVLVSWILIICMSVSSPTEMQIRFQDLQVKQEEDQLSKRMDGQIKDYINSISRDKAQMQQQMLLYQQEIYNSKKSDRQNNYQNGSNEGKQGTQYEYYYEEEEENNQQDWIQQPNQKVGGQEGFQATPKNTPNLSAPLSPHLAHDTSKSLKKTPSRLQVQPRRVPNQQGEIDSVVQSQLQKSIIGPQSKTPTRPKHDGWQQLNQFALETEEKPISEELTKLLKITLFSNSPFFNRNRPQLQQQCPLQKYLDKDKRYEISDPNKFVIKKNTNRKNEYVKQELVFTRKRKEKAHELQEKNVLRQEFDESLALKRERVYLLNQQKLARAEQLEREKEDNMSLRYKKFNIIDSIRSKYTD